MARATIKTRASHHDPAVRQFLMGSVASCSNDRPIVAQADSLAWRAKTGLAREKTRRAGA